MSVPSNTAALPELVERAEALVNAGALEQARELLLPLVDDDAPAAVHNVLGVIAYLQGRLLDAERELQRACARPDAGPDAVTNLGLVRAALEAAGAPEAREPGRLRAQAAPARLGRLLGAEIDRDVDQFLVDVPSACTVAERRLLLRYTATLWDGRGDVFENGPLLGGSTRALAVGMLLNPNRDPKALLHTYDWFSNRVALDLEPGTFERLIAQGLLSAQQYEEARALGSFKPLYEVLHSGHEYSPLVRAHVGYLPGHRGDVPEHGEAIFSAPCDRDFSIVFVDGCKSWYGTKHWLIELCTRIAAGAHFLFQDFGQYTCFWLSSLVGLLSDHFELIAHVDHTYAFRLRSAIAPELVQSRFPDEPTDLDRAAFDAIYDRLLADAGARGDTFGMMAAATQRAAAYAYIGLHDEARAAIDGLLQRREFAAHRPYLLNARRSPTYTPEGDIRL